MSLSVSSPGAVVGRRYNAVAVALHWLTVLAILLLLAMGWVMTSLPLGSPLQFTLFQLHKSVGMTVLALTLFRLVWRLAHRPPPLPDSMGPLERLVAHLGHFGLYALLLGLPLIGWGVVSTSPYNIPTVLYGLIPLPHLAFLADLADRQALNKLLENGHGLAAYLLTALVVGHAAAALRHHFLLKDDVLARMLPRFGGKS